MLAEAGPPKLAAFTAFQLDGNREIGLTVRELNEVALQLHGGGALALRDAGITARRRDLAGEGPEVPLIADRVPLSPGNWRITVRPPAEHYPEDVSLGDGRFRRPRKDPDPNWFEFTRPAPPSPRRCICSPPRRKPGGK